MGSLVSLAQKRRQMPTDLVKAAEPLPTLTESKQTAAQKRLRIIQSAVQRMVRDGVSPGVAARELFVVRGERQPSVSTLKRWLQAYVENPRMEALAPAHCRPRKAYGWERRVLEMYRMPSKPSRVTCAEWARAEGYASATNSRVNYFLKHLPKTVTDASIARNGSDYYHDNITPYVERDYQNLGVGEEWVSDGHTLKVFCRNPATGDAYRMELTSVLDVKSNYLIAWWWSRAESAETTVYAFCSALRACGNVPVWFYTDNGSGFKNERMAALLDQLGIRHILGIPRHKRARGFGEGWHHLLTEKFAKSFGNVYCGEARTDDGLSRMRRRIETGELDAPTDIEVQERFREFAAFYNARVQTRGSKIAGHAPKDFLPQWVKNPLNVPVHALIRPWIRPSNPPTVRRASIRFENRQYASNDLLPFEGTQVRAQYDRYDESLIWVYDKQGRFIAEVPLRRKAPHVQENVAADDRERSRLAANARTQAKIDRNNDNHRTVLSPGNVIDALEHGEPQLVPAMSQLILDQGHAVRLPDVPAPSRKRNEINAASFADLKAEAAADRAALEADTETPSERLARALDLEARQAAHETLSATDAQWLAIYQTGSEYHTQLALREDLRDDPEETF